MNNFILISIFLVSSASLVSSQIAWGQWGWAYACDFIGRDLANLTCPNFELCSTKCREQPGCTHYTWKPLKGGTCKLKFGTVSKQDAVYTSDNTMICAIDIAGPIIQTVIDKGALLWSDEFNGTGKPNAANWRYDIGGWGWGNNELQYYTDSVNNSYLEGGALIIEARKEDFGSKKYTSARLLTKRKFKYGIFEMRAKLPKGKGTWPAFWLLSSKNPIDWPEDGEIDIMEHVGHVPNRIQANIHCTKYNHVNGLGKGSSIYLNNVFDEWHTYTLDWNAKRLIFYVDDRQYLVYTNQDNSVDTWPFDNEFDIILNSAIGGSFGGTQGIDDSIFPAKYIIDYVRHYAHK